jgi:predicted O-methyltransferase YrrM
MEGKASESLEKLSHLSGLDFVFMDADKAGTPAYLQWAIPRLRSGGMVIVDNAYAWGAMSHLGSSDLGPSGPPTSVPPKGRFDHWSLKDFEAMSLSWRILAESPELHSVVIPTGEGMAVGLKLR